MIQFLFNSEMIEQESFAPNLNVLDWLRTKMGKTGSKEGCGSGDCGACTVVIGDFVDGQWHYKSINACLMLLAHLHGKHLITVEALTTTIAPGIEDLHPVQKAMVECHGSQCGFCTPGFIMSLFALYMNHQAYPGKAAVIQALGGNLCRCTGYQPILKAAEKCFSYQSSAENTISHSEHRFTKQRNLLTERLQQALSEQTSPVIKHAQQQFYLPQNLTQLCTLKSANPNAKFVAGGTDLSVEFSQQLIECDTLISVCYCSELMRFSQDASGLHIGAALPYSEFVETFCEVYPEAHELFERLGSLQVRNAGSLGGSIANASPIGDPAPLLIALNATLEIHSTRGHRMIAIDEFFTDYRQTQLENDEVIVAIHIPPRSADFALSCHKVSKRIEDDISTVCLILAYQYQEQSMQNVRCAMGGMAATPALAKHVSASLEGKSRTLENLQDAAEKISSDFQPMSDVRASSSYRLQVSKNLFSRIYYQSLQAINLQQLPVTASATTENNQTRIKHASL